MGDHSSVDINCLATSLRGKLENLHPLSEDCCIYRVPQETRRSNEKLFTPAMVSIGPLHHDREELKAMEEHKHRYLQHFLQRTLISLEEFLASIKDKETRLRDCYAETIILGSQKFVEMMLLDGIFLVEFLLRYRHLEFRTSDDRIFGKPWLSVSIERDILSVENQIPFFILEDLFQLAKTRIPENQSYYEGVFMSNLVSYYCNDLGQEISIDKSLLETNFSGAKHFLDLLRLCFEPPDNDQVVNEPEPFFYPTNSLSIRDLHEAGIKFTVGSSKHLCDIRFDKETLEISKLRMNVPVLLKHLLILEGLHCSTNHINDYALFLGSLVTSPEDAELLIQNKIIESTGSLEASSFCQELCQHATVVGHKFKYSSLVRHLNAY